MQNCSSNIDIRVSYVSIITCAMSIILLVVSLCAAFFGLRPQSAQFSTAAAATQTASSAAASNDLSSSLQQLNTTLAVTLRTLSASLSTTKNEQRLTLAVSSSAHADLLKLDPTSHPIYAYTIQTQFSEATLSINSTIKAVYRSILFDPLPVQANLFDQQPLIILSPALYVDVFPLNVSSSIIPPSPTFFPSQTLLSADLKFERSLCVTPCVTKCALLLDGRWIIDLSTNQGFKPAVTTILTSDGAKCLLSISGVVTVLGTTSQTRFEPFGTQIAVLRNDPFEDSSSLTTHQLIGIALGCSIALMVLLVVVGYFARRLIVKALAPTDPKIELVLAKAAAEGEDIKQPRVWRFDSAVAINDVDAHRARTLEPSLSTVENSQNSKSSQDLSPKNLPNELQKKDGLGRFFIYQAPDEAEESIARREEQLKNAAESMPQSPESSRWV